jgi:predicted alpha/beta superfamily hydrolase
MSLYAVTKYNNVFSKAACVSSSIFMVMQPLMDDIYHSDIDPDTRVYLSWGEKEGGTDPDSGYCKFLTNSNRKVEKLLNRKGAITRLYCQPGGGHCEADWEKEVPDFMDFLWK